MKYASCIISLALLLPAITLAAEPPVVQNIAKEVADVRSVGAKGENHKAVQAAIEKLQSRNEHYIPQLLEGMDGANPLAENWLRGVIETIAARGTNVKQTLPLAELEKFLNDTKHGPRSRRLAFELLVRENKDAEKKLLTNLLDDTSLELRRDAVQLIIEEALAHEQAKANEAAVKSFAQALIHARDLDQVQLLGKKLQALEHPIDMPSRLGFIMNWRLLGPFDNVADIGWDTAYEPEAKVDFKAEYKGQKGAMSWISHTTKDDFGLVDLAAALDKHKGAVAYAATEFIAERERSVKLRLGCINAHKVWVNGELVGTNHVYHTGIEIDQYTFPVKLRPGKNLILLKICQNEQTEPWAQRWQFQLRVSDDLGGPVLSQDREVPKTASK